MTAQLKSRIYFWYDTVYPVDYPPRRRIGALALDDKGRILITTAVCSDKDAFIKKTGRAKASGRMQSLLERNECRFGKIFNSLDEIRILDPWDALDAFGGTLPTQGEKPLIDNLVRLAQTHPV